MQSVASEREYTPYAVNDPAVELFVREQVRPGDSYVDLATASGISAIQRAKLGRDRVFLRCHSSESVPRALALAPRLVTEDRLAAIIWPAGDFEAREIVRAGLDDLGYTHFKVSFDEIGPILDPYMPGEECGPIFSLAGWYVAEQVGATV